MKIRIRKREDGTMDVEVRRTRHGEKPTKSRYGVAPEKVQEALSELVPSVADPARRQE